MTTQPKTFLAYKGLIADKMSRVKLADCHFFNLHGLNWSAVKDGNSYLLMIMHEGQGVTASMTYSESPQEIINKLENQFNTTLLKGYLENCVTRLSSAPNRAAFIQKILEANNG
jgi:hypothetical protein